MRRSARFRARARWAMVLAGGFLVWAASAGSAHALSLTVPAQALRSADVTMTLGSGDPTGTLSLFVDGAPVRTWDVTASGSSVSLTGLPLAQGTRSLTARIVGAGGVTAEAATATVTVWDTPDAPVLSSPTGGYVAASVPLVIVAGRSTSSVAVFVDWVPVGTFSCSPGAVVNAGTVWMDPGWHLVRVVAANPFGESRVTEAGFSRLAYPASTCIVVDKSDFRLYWVQNDVLVKTYPIAIGKRRTQTPNAMWIVGRKEYMPPRGVYGPRRLKLARLVRYRGRWRYKMTGYGIHGTNEPWVIGTMASHGCIRLTNDQILDLWPQVPQGTIVQTRP